MIISRRGIIGSGVAPIPNIPQANLRAWFRADLGITLNGSAVSAWADQTSNHFDIAQATGANQPTFTASEPTLNNRPCLTFTGSQWLAGVAAGLVASGGKFTLYAVAKTNGGDAQGIVSTTASNMLDVYGRDNTGNGGTLGSLAFYRGGAVDKFSNSLADLSLSPARIICIVFDVPGANSTAYVSSLTAQSMTAGDGGTGPIDSIQIGRKSNSFGLLTGKVPEAAYYSVAHDATARANVINYMSTLYNIALL